jgi:hypothetical protein
MANSNVQLEKFELITGAIGYRSRSDITATPAQYLVSGSQNVLINEATDKDGDKVETRQGYELFGIASTDQFGIKSEFTFKTKAGNTIMGRMDTNGDLEYYSEQSDAWETLLTGLNGSYPIRWSTAHNPTELLRVLLFVNHSSTLYEWSGAFGTYLSSTATTIVLNEVVATAGFLTTGTRYVRVKDSGGTWRTFTVTGQSGSTLTVTEDPTAYTFTANAIVVQAVRENANKPASGFTADTIKTLQNHVYIGSHASSVVYMSQSDDYTDFSFSSPRVPTEGWQFVLDSFNIGFSTNIGGNGLESLVMFAGDDWIYRVEFNQLGDASIIETLVVKPIIVAPGQGGVSQELISKMGNSIIFLNKYNELTNLGELESRSALVQTPLSDPIKPDFLSADFTGGSIRFWRNNLYVTAPASTKTFILSFRETADGTRSFWQPPQILPIGQMSDYNGDLIGHAIAVTESYTMFTGTNDNTLPISFKAHFAYVNNGVREKLKNFNTYFTEVYLTVNADITHTIIFDYLGARQIQAFNYLGTETEFLFTPNPSASLGVNALGTSPLGATLSEPSAYLKYRRFKTVVPTDYFEYQVRYEMDVIDGRFQILAHGSSPMISANAPAKLKK